MKSSLLYVLSCLLVFNFVNSLPIDCPSIYQRYSRNHSFCKPKNISCNIERVGLTPQEINDVLSIHNTLRSMIAMHNEESYNLTDFPTAANMLQMEWDEELASVAQKYIEQCIYDHDKFEQRQVRNFIVGQNLALANLTGLNLSPPEPNWSQAITGFFSEIVDYKSEFVSSHQHSDPDKKIGHFTQVIWASTFRIGCGYVLYKHENSYIRLYICNYGPSGNTLGKAVYKIGPPCSQCPQNTCCGKTCPPGSLIKPTYPGLCKRYNNQAPYTPVKQPIFHCNFQDSQIEDCLFNVEGPRKWEIIPALGGNFLEIVLYAGEESTLTFVKSLKPNSNKFCIFTKYRKGPTKDGSPENSTAIETFTIPSKNFSLPENLHDFPYNNEFNIFSADINWDKETQVKISFAVGANADPQFFDIDSIIAVDGHCEHYKTNLD